jgi:hypothetical protein
MAVLVVGRGRGIGGDDSVQHLSGNVSGQPVFLAGRACLQKTESTANRIFVQNQAPIGGGVIAGGALPDIIGIRSENFMLSP